MTSYGLYLLVSGPFLLRIIYIYARGLTQAGMYSIVRRFSWLSSIRLCEQTRLSMLLLMGF